MKISSKSLLFARQVQQDLLALSEGDLFSTIHQWVEIGSSSEIPLDLQEEMRSALGYIRVPAEQNLSPHPLSASPETTEAEVKQWLVPSQHSLRTLITAMDVNMFARYVIPLAFVSLHSTYPEWDEGVIFNAHLANYLRQIKRRSTSNI